MGCLAKSVLRTGDDGAAHRGYAFVSAAVLLTTLSARSRFLNTTQVWRVAALR
jgi:hypothetical protein